MKTILPDTEEGVTVQRLMKLTAVMEKVKLFLRLNSLDCLSFIIFILMNITKPVMNIIIITATQKSIVKGFINREKLYIFLDFVDIKKLFSYPTFPIEN